jgi:hypothetical protein
VKNSQAKVLEEQTRMEPLVLIFATSLVKSTRLRPLIVRALLAMNSLFSRKRQRRKGGRFYRSQSRLQCQFHPILTMQYQACTSTSEVSRTQSQNFAVSTTSHVTVTIHHLKSRFAKMTSESKFQNLDAEPTYGAPANSREATKKYTQLIYTCWSP